MADVKVLAPQGGAEKVAELTKGQPIKSGIMLVKALSLSGTPDRNLEDARKSLDHAWSGGKALTAQEVLAVMEKAPHMSPGTLKKARTLIESGRLVAVKAADVPVEDRIMAELEKEKTSVKR